MAFAGSPLVYGPLLVFLFPDSDEINYAGLAGKEMDLCFENLSMSLQRKYSQFKKTNSDRDIIEYQDSNVGITLSREYLQNHYMFGIDYSDLFLMGIAFSEGDDDL